MRARRLFSAIALALAGAGGLAAGAAASDFRGSDWGADRAAVKAAERLPLKEEAATELVYTAAIGKLDGEVHYRFGEHGLWRATIVSLEAYDDPLHHIGDFATLREIVTRAHGAPDQDESRFTDEAVRSDPERWPEALRNGGMMMGALWMRPRTTVSLLLSGSGGRVSLIAEFVSTQVPEDGE
jgi:hypothetical protein